MLPLLFRHIDLEPEQVTVISRSQDKTGIASKFGVAFVAQPLRQENFEAVLDAHIGEGDFLLNLSVEVASLALISYCWRRGILYLDTCIEPWPGRSDWWMPCLSQVYRFRVNPSGSSKTSSQPIDASISGDC